MRRGESRNKRSTVQMNFLPKKLRLRSGQVGVSVCVCVSIRVSNVNLTDDSSSHTKFGRKKEQPKKFFKKERERRDK